MLSNIVVGWKFSERACELGSVMSGKEALHRVSNKVGCVRCIAAQWVKLIILSIPPIYITQKLWPLCTPVPRRVSVATKEFEKERQERIDISWNSFIMIFHLNRLGPELNQGSWVSTGMLYVVYISILCSSNIAAVLSNEHVAKTWPNSGCAHVTRHTEP